MSENTPHLEAEVQAAPEAAGGFGMDLWQWPRKAGVLLTPGLLLSDPTTATALKA